VAGTGPSKSPLSIRVFYDDVRFMYGGQQVHDANLVATMLVHGIGTVVTMNPADFARFERHVSLIQL
jgi:hypothetical protein